MVECSGTASIPAQRGQDKVKNGWSPQSFFCISSRASDVGVRQTVEGEVKSRMNKDHRTQVLTARSIILRKRHKKVPVASRCPCSRVLWRLWWWQWKQQPSQPHESKESPHLG